MADHLDDLLQQALDEFEEDSTAPAPVDIDAASDRAARAAASVSAPRPATDSSSAPGLSSTAGPSPDVDPAAALEKLLRDMTGDDFQRHLAAIIGDASTSSGQASGAGQGGSGPATDGPESDAELLRTLELLQRMTAGAASGGGASATAGGGGGSSGGDNPASEEDLRRLSEELERLGAEGGGLPASMDGMMQQLVSRDVMYEPMAAIASRLPSWIAEHGERIGAAERARYTAQLAAYRRVLAHYDSEPGNFPRLMELIAELQAHGQPPPEIVSELAPGLDLGGDGGAAGGGLGLLGGQAGAPECAVM